MLFAHWGGILLQADLNSKGGTNILYKQLSSQQEHDIAPEAASVVDNYRAWR